MMKEIVRKIFGDEAANDPEIVAFYEDVQKIAMESYHQARSQEEAKERYDEAIIRLNAIIKLAAGLDNKTKR